MNGSGEPAGSTRALLLSRLAHPENSILAEKTVLVTGGSGQIGLCVVGKALARGARVIALFHKTVVAFSHPNLEWVQRDLTQSKLEGLKADVLIHTLPIWTLSGLLESAHTSGIHRVIGFSSTSRFGKVSSKNRYEQDIVEQLISGEEQVMKRASEKGMSVTILRPTMVYGLGLDANITRLANTVRKLGFLAVCGPASGMRSPVQASDLADAALGAAFNPATGGKCYNLGGGEALSYNDMLVAIFRHLGKKPRIVWLPFLPLLLDVLGRIYGGGHINGQMARRMNQDLLFDMKDAMNDFGYRPKGFLKGDVVI